jgi:hypothetical protein
VGGVAPGQQLAVQQQPVTGLPAGDLVSGQRVEIDPAPTR